MLYRVILSLDLILNRVGKHCKGAVTSAEIGIQDIRLNNRIMQTSKDGNSIVQLYKIRNFVWVHAYWNVYEKGEVTLHLYKKQAVREQVSRNDISG